MKKTGSKGAHHQVSSSLKDPYSCVIRAFAHTTVHSKAGMGVYKCDCLASSKVWELGRNDPEENVSAGHPFSSYMLYVTGTWVLAAACKGEYIRPWTFFLQFKSFQFLRRRQGVGKGVPTWLNKWQSAQQKIKPSKNMDLQLLTVSLFTRFMVLKIIAKFYWST